MNEYIERGAFIKHECNSCDGLCDKVSCDCLSCSHPCRCDFILSLLEFPAADVMEVVPDLKNTVRLLHRAYEQAKRAHHVRDPLAYAVYQVWKTLDGRRKHGNPD